MTWLDISPRGAARRLLLALGASVALIGAASAQATKSETRFEDWVVACDDSSGTKACSLSQTFTKAGTGNIVLAFILGKTGDGTLKAVVYAPTQVLLAPGLTVNVGSREPIVAPYLYCAPQACIAEFAFPDEWIEEYKKLTQYTVTFQPVGQKPATVSGSLKGFMAALDFFQKQ